MSENEIIRDKVLDNSQTFIEVPLEDLDKQLEFYTDTIVQFEKLNHQYITRINRLQRENNHYKAILNTKVYRFASYLRRFIDKLKRLKSW